MELEREWGMAKALNVSGRRRALFALIGGLMGGAGAACAQTPPASEARSQLFLFQYTQGPAWRSGAPMREQGLGPHAAYMQQLQSEGRLFAGGGYASDDGGMAIIAARDIEEARAILAADPAITSGIFVAELRHWRVRFRTYAALP
jgi:uncharacterized protein YciI